jgi:hypothetical protein
VVGSLKCSGSSGSAGAGGISGFWWIPPTLSDGALGDNGAAAGSSSSSRLAVLSGDYTTVTFPQISLSYDHTLDA